MDGGIQADHRLNFSWQSLKNKMVYKGQNWISKKVGEHGSNNRHTGGQRYKE